MKRLYLIGGSMGVGKTATCQTLKNYLPNSVFLDGDWCWDMHPFVVTDETKRMVMGNICFLLNSFLKCSAYDNVIFCWVMHEQDIINEIIDRLDLDPLNHEVHPVSLVATPAALNERLLKDVADGLRTADVIGRSLERLPLYDRLDTRKIDISHLTPREAARAVVSRF